MSSTIRERLSQLMESRNVCDITVEVGKEKKCFPTHTFLLSMYSEVFKSWFYDSLKDKIPSITLSNDDAEAFEVFLTYIHTDEIKIKSVDQAFSSIHFSEKYAVQKMKNKSLLYLQNNLSTANVLKIYEKASDLEETQLKCRCMEFIANNCSAVMKSDDFSKYVTFETMMNIVSEENLTLDSEVDLYHAIVKWGKEKYHDPAPDVLREKLNPFLQKVRFLAMTPSEFVDGPCKEEILTKNEQFEILKAISTTKMCENNDLYDHQRMPRKSHAKLNKWLYLHPVNHECRNDNFNSPVVLEFRPKRLLYITGMNYQIQCHSAVLNYSEIKYNMVLVITNLSSKISENCKKTVTIGTEFRNSFIKLTSPILAEPDDDIRIEFKFTHPTGYEDIQLFDYFKIRFRTSLLFSIEKKLSMHILSYDMKEYIYETFFPKFWSCV